MPVETDLYDILGVSPTATGREITTAYRKLAMVHHPDRGGDTEEFKKIQGAYDTLSNPDKKDKYDKFGKNGLKGSGGIPSEMFTSMFGNMFGGDINNMFNAFRQARTHSQKCKPTVYKHEVTLEDVCNRNVVKLRFTRDRICSCDNNDGYSTCDKCSGQGRIIQLKQIGPGMLQQPHHLCDKCSGMGKLYPSCEHCKHRIRKIPKIFHLHLTPELENGYQYVFKGEGNQVHGGEPGDFIVILNHKKHETFTFEGNDLLVTKNLTLKEALCGFSFVLMHPSGEKITVTGSNVTSPTTVTRVENKGMSENSALIIRFTVTFPEKLEKEQIPALTEIL